MSVAWHTVYDIATGEISGLVSSHVDDLVANTPPGAATVDGRHDSATGWVNAGAFVAYTGPQAAAKAARPAHDARWDNGAGAWVDTRTLAQAKLGAARRVKAGRIAAIAQAGTTTVGVFQTQPEDLANITSVAAMLIANPLILSVRFTLADNTRPTISRVDFLAAAQTVGVAVQTVYDTAHTLRTQIAAATTIAEADAIVWPA